MVPSERFSCWRWRKCPRNLPSAIAVDALRKNTQAPCMRNPQSAATHKKKAVSCASSTTYTRVWGDTFGVSGRIFLRDTMMTSTFPYSGREIFAKDVRYRQRTNSCRLQKIPFNSVLLIRHPLDTLHHDSRPNARRLNN